MAAIWTAGRESMLVDDRLDRTTKEAMNAVLSQVNDCPYCGDMLISLVHAGGQHEAASNIFAKAKRQSPTILYASALPGSSPSRAQVKNNTHRRHSRLRNCRKLSRL